MLRRTILLFAAFCAWPAAGRSECAEASCAAASEAESSAFVQTKKTAAGRQTLADRQRAAGGGQVLSADGSRELPRITVVEGKLKRGDVEVLPLGGNYAVKAQPYYPPVQVVEQDAKAMAAGVTSSTYTLSDGRVVVPMVRLTTYFEGAMPNEPGVFDGAWQAKLEATVKAFAKEGVYVLLDIHQDALATTNGGAGLPWWMTAYMQETAGSVPGCITCGKGDSYISTPEHPLDLALPDWVQTTLLGLGFDLPVVKVINSTDPWLAYSVGGNAGDPRSMNVGNINMRANNNDAGWQRGTLPLTRQVQKAAWRFYRAHKYPKDKAAIFDHYMTFVKYLCTVWEGYSNVVAIELLNEPPFSGLPDLVDAANSRTSLFDFYAAVLSELEAEPTPTMAPMVIEDVGGASLPAVVDAVAELFMVDDISNEAYAKLKQWSAKGQLIYEFHWYPNSMTQESFEKYLKGAKALANSIGNPPIYLGEFWTGESKDSAYWLAMASELGCSAATYWQYVDTDYTKTGGWFIYPDGVPDGFLDVTSPDDIDWEAWNTYEKTVADGTYWGAYICGAAGGHMGVLNDLKPVSMPAPSVPSPISTSKPQPPVLSGGGHGSSRRTSER